MSTVLVNAYHYPPEEGSCSEKNIRIVKALKDAGYNVIVLTKAYKGLKTKTRLEDGTIIIRTNHNGIFHKVAPAECSSSNSVNISGTKAKIKKFLTDNLIPDSAIDWVSEVKKTYCKHKEVLKNANIILSISSPYSAHLASSFLAEKLNIPYVMCYGDPWIYEPKRKRGKVRYAYEKRLEQKLIDGASKILLITKWNKKKYQELYKINPEKIYTYFIGYDESECLLGISPIDNGVLKVIYGGSLDKVHRNPQPFIAAMAQVEGVKAYIYNSDNVDLPQLIEKYKVNDKVILLPIVGADEFYHKLYEMDTLLLFGNKTPFQIPGKVFTYISTRKDILYVKNNDSVDDGTAMVLSAYGNSATIKNTPDEIVECLEKMKKNLETGISPNAEQFEFHNTMKPIVEAIEAALL